MSLRRNWLWIPIITGIAALAVIWYAFTLFSSIEASMTKMSWKLYELQGPGGNYYSALDTAGLFILVFVVTMLLCGIVATLLSRPSGVSLVKGQYAAVLAASIPVIVIDVFLLLSYYNNTQQLYQDRISAGSYIAEPPFLPVYLLFIAIITIPGYILPAAGGVLAWWAINANKHAAG